MEQIIVHTTVNAPQEKVWDAWTSPEHIMNWNNASDDWYTPHAENDVREGGRFLSTMAARDGSAQFDFTGVYTAVVPYERIAYVMEDGRRVEVTFNDAPEGIVVTESFDPANENPREMQQEGWQAILDNFKKYTEALP